MAPSDSSKYVVPYDCEINCICDEDISECPNFQAFGKMLINYLWGDNLAETQQSEISVVNDENNLS